MAITSASYTLQGQTYQLTYDASTDFYTATITAPDTTSWFELDHQYVGTLSATGVDGLGVSTTVTQELGVRVLETGKPSIVVIDPEDWMINTTGTATMHWIASDEITGIDPDTVALKIDGEAVSDIIKTPYTTRNYICEWTGTVPAGIHTITFEAFDNDGNAADVVSLNYAVLLFITDRTQEDVDRVAELSELVKNGAATDEELVEWATDLKGAYNASDMNRVGWGTYFLQRLAERYGYAVDVTAKRDWTGDDITTRAQGETYIADSQTIRSTLPSFATTPYPPESARFLNYQGANDIEQILTDLPISITRTLTSFIYSGEAVSGEL